MKIENPVETLLGAVVIAVAVGFAIFAGQGRGLPAAAGSYPVLASFSSVSGVAPGTDVRIAGVKVGSVAEISLDPQSYRAEAVMMIRSDIELPEDTIAKIDAEGLLGGTFIALAPGASFDALEPGDEIENTQGAVSLGGLIAQVLGAMGSSSDN